MGPPAGGRGDPGCMWVDVGTLGVYASSCECSQRWKGLASTMQGACGIVA